MVLAPLVDLDAIADDEPGYGRRRRGSGFSYHDAFGKPLGDADVERIRSLAIPPAWEEVWISPSADGYLQATGIDAAGRKQYRYHEGFREFCEQQKFDRLVYVARAVPLIRKGVADALAEPLGTREHAVGAAVRLIDECLLRVGNHQSAEKGHYGATTLTVEHVVSDGVVTLEYLAKSGQQREVVVDDEELAGILTALAEDADDELFWFDDGEDRRRAVADDINRFIVEHAGSGFSAKDLRTWGGSSAALAARAGGADILRSIDAAAEELGNTRTVARNSYVHPDVLSVDDDVIAEVWSTSRSSKWLDRSESALAKLLGR